MPQKAQLVSRQCGYLNDITVTEGKWELLLKDFIKAKCAASIHG